MTTDSTESLKDDLAFLRSLVDDDWRPGLRVFGALYVAIGAVLCLHVFISWGAETGFLPLAGRSLLAAYAALYGGFAILWTWYGRRSRQLAQAGAARGVKNRTGGAALLSAFAGHLVMLAVLVIVAIRQKNWIFLELAPLVLFTLQAGLWFVIHALRRAPWHLAEAWGWLLAALALAPFVGAPAYGPGVGLAAFVLMIVPGVVMLRLARAGA